MKVKLAAQTLSNSTAAALEFLEKSGVQKFQGVKETVLFIRTIDEVFDFLNCRSPFGKGSKSPIVAGNLDTWEKEMNIVIKYLYSLKTVGDKYLYQSNRKTFILGFAVACKSVLAIARKLLLQPNSEFKFVLSYKFSQDYLELFFSKLRQRHGFNNNPNVLQLNFALKQILLKNDISPSCAANSAIFENDPSGNIFEIEWKKKKKNSEYEGEDDEEDVMETDFDTNIVSCSNNNTYLKENVLYYIGGFVIRKIVKKISCVECREGLVMNCSSEHRYCSLNEFSNFVDLKNQGGLVRVSVDVLRVVKVTEQVLCTVSNDLTDMSNIDNKLYNKIIIQTKNVLAEEHLFQCNESSDFRCHKVEVIKLIASQYLKIRFYALGKLTTERSNSTSKRHLLNKLVLFQNQ